MAREGGGGCRRGEEERKVKRVGRKRGDDVTDTLHQKLKKIKVSAADDWKVRSSCRPYPGTLFSDLKTTSDTWLEAQR